MPMSLIYDKLLRKIQKPWTIILDFHQERGPLGIHILDINLPVDLDNIMRQQLQEKVEWNLR
jgi:hypothetical protein